MYSLLTDSYFINNAKTRLLVCLLTEFFYWHFCAPLQLTTGVWKLPGHCGPCRGLCVQRILDCVGRCVIEILVKWACILDGKPLYENQPETCNADVNWTPESTTDTCMLYIFLPHFGILQVCQMAAVDCPVKNQVDSCIGCLSPIYNSSPVCPALYLNIPRSQ